MPYESDAQMRLMEGIRHGMTPRMKNPPSKKVADEFHRAEMEKQRRSAHAIRKRR